MQLIRSTRGDRAMLVACVVCIAAAPARADDDVLHEIEAQNAAVPNEAPVEAPSEPITGTVRLGIYADSDRTTVLRVLGVVGHSAGSWVLGASFDVDSVTSASVDVRSSPALSHVDTVTSASGRNSSSGGEMSDTRYQGTASAGWKDLQGHALTLTGAVAKETDYASVSGGVNGSYDILERNATLLGGITITDNWVSSVIDSTIQRKMLSIGWTAGLAHVLTPDDAIRVRYDGKANAGYNSSPYRNVRFGDWSAVLTPQKITFSNTIGSPDGLLERTPALRQSNALVGEWVHALWPGVGLHPELRVAHDNWGITSASAGVDLRLASRAGWRVEAGYRFYAQTSASFFRDKYTMDPSAYASYTSDKELGDQHGHLGRIDIAGPLKEGQGPNEARLMLNVQLVAIRYTYPGFVLLPQRDSVFASLGLSLER